MVQVYFCDMPLSFVFRHSQSPKQKIYAGCDKKYWVWLQMNIRPSSLSRITWEDDFSNHFIEWLYLARFEHRYWWGSCFVFDSSLLEKSNVFMQCMMPRSILRGNWQISCLLSLSKQHLGQLVRSVRRLFHHFSARRLLGPLLGHWAPLCSLSHQNVRSWSTLLRVTVRHSRAASSNNREQLILEIRAHCLSPIPSIDLPIPRSLMYSISCDAILRKVRWVVSILTVVVLPTVGD